MRGKNENYKGSTKSILLPARMAAPSLVRFTKTNCDHSQSIRRNRKRFGSTKVEHRLLSFVVADTAITLSLTKPQEIIK